MYSSLTSNCPRLMTLGQTRWCWNRVTHGALIHTETHRVPGPLGKTLKKLRSLVASHYSPLVRCFYQLCVCESEREREREYGVTLHWLTSGVTELARERRREEGSLHLLMHTHPARGYRLQPLFHLCLSDLPNDVFIYSIRRLMRATCHKHVTNRGIKEAHIEAPNADLDLPGPRVTHTAPPETTRKRRPRQTRR